MAIAGLSFIFIMGATGPTPKEPPETDVFMPLEGGLFVSSAPCEGDFLRAAEPAEDDNAALSLDFLCTYVWNTVIINFHDFFFFFFCSKKINLPLCCLA